MQPKFIHLHVHTEYSIVDGLIRIPELAANCSKMQMPAVAITDICNFFGLIKFYQKMIASGIKPIIGSDVHIVNPQDEHKPFQCTLLSQNAVGYKNITKLISRAYREGQHLGVPMLMREWLYELSAGIIVLSGGIDGDIGCYLMQGDMIQAENSLTAWKRHFPQNFYLELQRIGRAGEETNNQKTLELAIKYDIPIVATNNVRFLQAVDFEAHEARVCIHDGNILDDAQRSRLYTDQQYLRSVEEMEQLFADMPEALLNTVAIAKRCNVELPLNQIFLPNFPIPENTILEIYFTAEARNGLAKRSISADKNALYENRLTHEIKVIQEMGFPGYFLIVADFVKWSRENGIPVWAGRGSGSGSLVAYALGITDLDPIEHDLLFERFLNPERVSLPDFDIDFCMDGRDRVIEYVANRYGHDNVAQIITFGTMAAKAVIRDVGRVLGYPYGYVDKVAKLIPFELGITLTKALEQEVRLTQMLEQEEDVKTLIELALKLEGLTRNAGKHAAGVVIAPTALTDFTPLYCEENGAALVTQFDKNDVETIGLVKFDFLGLRTLTIINSAVIAINTKLRAEFLQEIDITKIPLDDKVTYDLLKACSTIAVFQLESRGMRDLIKRLQLDSFADIVAVNALFRPGPLQSGMVDDYVERKHGRSEVSYLHPLLKPILAPTYGVILYQEQVMQIAQFLAGYSLGSADILRRAMGKKKPEEMAKQRTFFIEGAAKNNVDKHLANHIFDLMEKFAGYGFNKSHSTGYAVIIYQTAWLKAHYPAEFMAAVLSSDMDNTDKIAIYIEECRKMKLTIIPPHVNTSQYKFTVNSDGAIVYGLGAIKGVGAAAVENILTARTAGVFTSLFDLGKRVDTHKVNKRGLEALIKSGAVDGLGAHRASLFASVALVLQSSEQIAQAKVNKQVDLFADIGEDSAEQLIYKETKEWDEENRLLFERDTLGIYLSGHPIGRYADELDALISAQINEISSSFSKVIIAGLIVQIRVVRTRNDKKMAIVTLDDNTGRIDVTVFSELYEGNREKLVKDQILVIEGDVSVDTFTDSYRIQSRGLYTLDEARAHYAKYLLLKIQEQQLESKPSFLANLKLLLQKYPGSCPITLQYEFANLSGKLTLSENWCVQITDELLQNIRDLSVVPVIIYSI